MKTTTAKEATRTGTASALAGKPISLARTTPFDVVLEKQPMEPLFLAQFLTGYKRPSEIETVRALCGPPGTKVGSVLGGVKACELVLHARETEAEISLRISRSDVGLGEVIEPDMRLTSLTMMGSSRFTEDNAWMVCQMAKCEETPEEMAARITERAFRIVNVVQHVPLPVSAALVDYLRVSGFHNLSIREPVARK